MQFIGIGLETTRRIGSEYDGLMRFEANDAWIMALRNDHERKEWMVDGLSERR